MGEKARRRETTGKTAPYGGGGDIKMDLREIGRDGVDWSDMAQEGSCEHGIETSGFLKCWEVLEWLHNWWLLKKGSFFFLMALQPNFKPWPPP
jgi:hypothetical protein